jgi:hypothetical protein
MAAGDREPALSAFQLEVARLFFALPGSQGFLLAGGAALLAQHLTARPTEDLDFFTSAEGGQLLTALDALETAARQRDWTAQRIHESDTFCRMVIRSADAGVVVDLAVYAPPDLTALYDLCRGGAEPAPKPFSSDRGPAAMRSLCDHAMLRRRLMMLPQRPAGRNAAIPVRRKGEK